SRPDRRLPRSAPSASCPPTRRSAAPCPPRSSASSPSRCRALRVFDFPFLRREPPVLKGKRATLRFPRPSDYREWAALRRDSRAFLEPWEPRWAPDELHRSGWNNRVRRYRQEYAAGSAIAYLIFENEENRMVGGITIGNIRYGVAQTAQIGYWMGERYA